MYGKDDETVNHILTECPKLAEKESKRQHFWIGKGFHWDVCRKFGFSVKENGRNIKTYYRMLINY